MNLIKIILTFLVLALFNTFELSAQISPAKSTKTWESNGLSTAPAVKTPENIDLGLSQRKETVAKMEKDEKELNDLAISGDGRLSKNEDVILNQIRTLRESIK
jgi:hypothetical protein